MKLITLNIWGGKIFKPLINFLKFHAENIDIFCFQEVFNNPPDIPSVIQKNPKLDIYSDIKKILPEFKGFIASRQDNEESLAIFVRNTLSLEKVDDIFIYRWKNAMENNDGSTVGINVQYARFQYDDKKYSVCNFHGYWTKEGKGDTQARLEQSKNLKKFLDSINDAKILCGDFNLSPNTESMKILENSNMRNLIKEFGSISTRSHFYKGEEKFSDYILVSPEIRVKKFEVLPDEISDHLALLLEFN